MYCKNCGRECSCKYCFDCKTERSNACSIIKQNTKKLEKLFKTKRYTPEGFAKFDLYVDNIKKQEEILMGFLEKDVIERFAGRRK